MIDLLFDADGDLLIVDGDFVAGDSVVQHQRDIILMDKGHHKFAPLVGVGAGRYLLDNNPRRFVAQCNLELKRDGLPQLTADEIQTILNQY